MLITGYGGFVAGSVASQAGDAWEVHAVSRKPRAGAPGGIHIHSLDLRDDEALHKCFDTVAPDAVIHAAAIADIDYCESHQDDAEAVNVTVTRDIAVCCGRAGSRLVYCSTDTVFDGAKGMYTEDDTAAPLNLYGKTKLRGESHVIEHTANAVIARLALVMGLPILGAGNSFLAKMMDRLGAGESMPFPENEVRTPVDVITLGAALLELAGNDYRGTIHLAGSTALNRYEMALRIVAVLGYPLELVTATDSNAMPGRAPRPNDVSLDNAKARELLSTPMRTLEEGLELVLESKKAACYE